MKKVSFVILLFLIVNSAYSQSYQQLPPCPDSSCLWGCGLPLKEVLNESEFVFEGRVLKDSLFCFNDYPYAYHRVLVLKEFKGVFISDTIALANVTINLNCKHQTLDGWDMPSVHSRVEGIFFISKYPDKDFDIPFISLGTIGCGFIPICDKKDVVKEVYEPIEAATGQKYMDVHPNTCKPVIQKTK